MSSVAKRIKTNIQTLDFLALARHHGWGRVKKARHLARQHWHEIRDMARKLRRKGVEIVGGLDA